MKLDPKHSSIQADPKVGLYYSGSCKYYYLPIFSEVLFSPILTKALGAKNIKKRTNEGIRASFVKAQRGHYSHVKVPLDRFDMEKLELLDRCSKEFELGLVFQVPTSFLYDEVFYKSLKNLNLNFEIEWVLDNFHYKVEPRLRELTDAFEKCHLSIVVHKNISWNDLSLAKVFKKFAEIHLYFPYQLSMNEPFLNCKESHKVLGILRKKFPGLSFLPPKGVDLWDRRAHSDFDMEPFDLPCFETQSTNPSIKYSVIIPTYNNQNHLRVVLRHLYRQSVGLDNFEVIVVDDGGTDQTQELVMELLGKFPKPMNFKYIFFKRTRQRVMGDAQYRAGISRNLGVKNAEGEYLCFLDSDIVTPSSYLESVGLALQEWGAVQARRINLSHDASYLDLNYEEIKGDADCIPDEDYWEQFNDSKSWHQVAYNWKYVCTHSFSMRKDVFWEVGGLKKNFIFYGFEDTDLGYRLVKAGYKLHLLDVKVYHLFHENTRSEFLNLRSLRHNLLSRTAQIFYLHHLDEDIYENLLGFMDPEPTFHRIFHRMVQTLSLQFIWKPSPKVYSVKGHRPSQGL